MAWERQKYEKQFNARIIIMMIAHVQITMHALAKGVRVITHIIVVYPLAVIIAV